MQLRKTWCDFSRITQGKYYCVSPITDPSGKIEPGITILMDDGSIDLGAKTIETFLKSIQETLNDEEYPVYLDEHNIPEKAQIVFNFPMKCPLTVEYTGSNFQDLAKFIRTTYRKIYKEEAESQHQVGPNITRFNRPSTDGIYGIYGWDLENLVLESIYLNKHDDQIYLSIGT